MRSHFYFVSCCRNDDGYFLRVRGCSGRRQGQEGLNEAIDVTKRDDAVLHSTFCTSMLDDVIVQIVENFVAMANGSSDPSFQAFRLAWLKTDLPLLFEVRLDSEPLDLFVESVFNHLLDMLLDVNPYENRVLFAWLAFALYACFQEQPANPRHRISLAWNDWTCYLRLLKFASESPDLSDTCFILYRLYKDNALRFCVARRCAPVAPAMQNSAPFKPFHRLVDVDNLAKCIDDYEEEASSHNDVKLETAKMSDVLEELESILCLRPIQNISTVVQDTQSLVTESNLEEFNALNDERDGDDVLFLSYRREDDQSSTDYDEADVGSEEAIPPIIQ